MADVTITVRKKGPYIVSGTVEVRDGDGNVYPAKEAVALCRCGASTNKPSVTAPTRRRASRPQSAPSRARPRDSA